MSRHDERQALWGGGLIVFVLGAIIHWRYRDFVNADAVQYIDVARRLYAGEWWAAANPVWSPLYPLLVRLAMLPAADHPANWYVAAQVVNVFAELVVLTCLGRFMLTALRRRDPDTALPSHLVIWCGWAGAFLFLHYAAINRTMNPDLLVCACVITIATELMMPPAERDSWWAIRFGTLLAFGYYVKAVLFVLSAAVVAAMFVTSVLRRRMRTVIVVATTWLVLIAPLAAVVSARAGHPTFGDAGRLVYDWWVNRGPFFPINMPGPDGSVMTQVCSTEAGYSWTEYPTPITYPPFYEPSFWRADYEVPLSLPAQWRSLNRIAGEFGEAIFPILGLLAPLTVLFASGWRGTLAWRPFLAVFALSAALIAAYLPVHIELRFFTASMMLMTVAAVAAVRGQLTPRARYIAVATWVGAVAITGSLTAGSVKHFGLAVTGTAASDVAPIHRAAADLPNLGVPPGSRVAIIGNDLKLAWAQYAGLRVVAEIPADNISQRPLTPESAATYAACLAPPGSPVDAVLSLIPLSRDTPDWRIGALSGVAVYQR